MLQNYFYFHAISIVDTNQFFTTKTNEKKDTKKLYRKQKQKNLFRKSKTFTKQFSNKKYIQNKMRSFEM